MAVTLSEVQRPGFVGRQQVSGSARLRAKGERLPAGWIRSPGLRAQFLVRPVGVQRIELVIASEVPNTADEAAPNRLTRPPPAADLLSPLAATSSEDFRGPRVGIQAPLDRSRVQRALDPTPGTDTLATPFRGRPDLRRISGTLNNSSDAIAMTTAALCPIRRGALAVTRPNASRSRSFRAPPRFARRASCHLSAAASARTRALRFWRQPTFL